MADKSTGEKSVSRSPNRSPMEQTGADHPFARQLTLPDAVLLAGSLAFIGIAIIGVFIEYRATGVPDVYTLLRGVHYQLSRYGLVVGVGMLALAVYTGIIRKGDVTPWFRRGSYVIFGTMLIQALIGMVMLYIFGVEPGAPEHLIYGFGTVLTLPFFIFVETTAKKRPAMGSYIWGFALLLGVIIRAISTGPR